MLRPLWSSLACAVFLLNFTGCVQKAGNTQVGLTKCGISLSSDGSISSDILTQDRSWAEPSLQNSDFISARVVSDREGNTTVVYQTGEGKIQALRLATLDCAFSEATQLDGGAGAEAPALAPAIENTNLTVVFTEINTAKKSVYARKYDSELATWDSAQLLETDDTMDAENPVVAYDSFNNIFVAWEFDNGATRSIYVTRFDNGTSTWSAPQEIDAGAATATSVRLSVSAAGDALVAWIQDSGGQPSLYASIYDEAGDSWAAAALVESDDTQPVSEIFVGMDPIGNAIVVWEQSSSGQDSVFQSLYTTGVGFAAPALVETDDTQAAQPQGLWVDSTTGDVIVLYSLFDGATGHLKTSYYDFSSTTWSPFDVASGGDSVPLAHLAGRADGSAIVIYQNTDATTHTLYSTEMSANDHRWSSSKKVAIRDEASNINQQISTFGSSTVKRDIAIWGVQNGAQYQLYTVTR